MSAPPDITGILDFLRAAEGLKTTTRNAWTSAGTQESVAEHTWRLCLMAMVLHPRLPDVDIARLLKMCLIHDLGEIIRGDVPAPDQAGLPAGKATEERQDLLTVIKSLPRASQDEIIELWDEYETGATAEARLAKGLDKLETILQHTQGMNPPGFDYGFNLGYGRDYTGMHPLLAGIRAELDAATSRRRDESGVG
jgi:putative hydrolase of HD superfamily